MQTPTVTYRIQFNKDFTFKSLAKILPYLHTLGIKTIYASPILQATAGSNHGYDGTDFHIINPEIGTYEELRALKKKLKSLGIGWLQDIVPNHMAFDQTNTWLMNLLEYGKDSHYVDYFDTSLSGNWFENEKLMVPTLGEPITDCIRNGKIKLTLLEEKLYLTYYDQYWPISPESTKKILEKNKSDAADQLSQEKLEKQIAAINRSDDKLQKIVDEQHYRLCHWQETDENITFRRFFTVNGLICLHINNKQVFEDTHVLIKQLINEKIIDGLRVDHVDGIYNPTQYLKDLRNLSGSETYIVAEKILESGEKLPVDWPIQGTTGYDFLALSNNLQVCTDGEKKLTKFYERFAGKQASLKLQQRTKKAYILEQHMQGELHNLAKLFTRLHLADHNSSIDEAKLKESIACFLVYFPVYRIYEEHFPFSDANFNLVTNVIEKAKKSNRHLHDELSLLSQVISQAQQQDNEEYRSRAITFFMRCMQFTGPVMAKGVEDTLMYTYNRFIGLNEVGDHPENFGLDSDKFHKMMIKRQELWPNALSASATHDTKRGEDARSRLHVLSACPELWIKNVKKWQRVVEKEYNGVLPHPNDIYFIYQSIYASHPMPETSDDDFEQRLLAYLEKYLREGKERSDWAHPDEEYENVVQQFARFLLKKEGTFYHYFRDFLISTVDFAIVHSLTQVLLKFTAPGIPDVYQGTELWDFSFVDPDNRRPVNYTDRLSKLKEINAIPTGERLKTLWQNRYDGKIKLALLQQLADLRFSSSSLAAEAGYIPLTISGKYQNQLLAFVRQFRNEFTVVILPLYVAGINKFRQQPMEHWDWEDTHIVLPAADDIAWKNLLNNSVGNGATIQINDLFTTVPFALIRYELTTNPRKSGILMHISSLPSDFGLGDLGKPAHDFAKALYAAGQQYWQILPLGPLSKEQYYSPYSTLSTMAGNPLFIDLLALEKQGLLDVSDIQAVSVLSSSKVDYDEVAKNKLEALYKAYDRAKGKEDIQFQEFCSKEAHWLDDYALFMVLRAHHQDSPWYTWKTALKKRDAKQLFSFQEAEKESIAREKWMQYIFSKQWKALQEFCHQLRIELLGDIPIYVGHDSADVWANPSLFELTADGNIKQMAGVPPDYFNADGQQWGMPVFNWANHKKNKYAWWITRIARNLDLFSRVRLDHFRAFSAYWSIPANAKTASEGSWQNGPGNDLFSVLQSEFEDMPFIAEDLGDIDDKVYNLRDNYKLPGMKVLQFAFGADLSKSPHIPHNYDKNFVVYTGTHDNNTTVGWFKQELDEASRKRLQSYIASTVYVRNVADMLIKTAFASIAETVIIPMQDILSLGRKHRMNTPASTEDNWTWRMLPSAFRTQIIEKLKEYNNLYNRN